MIPSTIGLLLLVAGLLIAFIGVRSGLVFLALPAVMLLVWIVGATEIRLVYFEGNEKEQEMFLALPWGDASYTYEGKEYMIPTEEDVAVVNMTMDHDIELYRHGMEWLFGLISVSQEHVIVGPGEVAEISGDIKAERNAHASYFTLKLLPVENGEDGNDG